jgi:hypothetical protein
VQNVWQTLNSGLFGRRGAGRLSLLKRGRSRARVVITSLPDSFFTHTRATPDMITNRTTGVASRRMHDYPFGGYSVSPAQQVI